MGQLTNDNMNYIASGKYIRKMHLLDDFCSLDNIAEDKEGNPLLHRDDTVRNTKMPVQIRSTAHFGRRVSCLYIQH